jgi:phosphoribosylcarboxyaminoimidazole (NCAIR) mutase
LAARILAVADEKVAAKYVTMHQEMAEQVRAQDKGIQARYENEAGGS